MTTEPLYTYQLDPYANALYLFCGRDSRKLKALHYDKDGFVLYQKRLDENGRFQWPRNASEARLLTRQEFRWLMEGLAIDQPKAIRPSKEKKGKWMDEWLIHPLSPQESYDLLEITETRYQRSMILCTQYQSEDRYTRIDPNPESDSPVSEAITDRIIHNSHMIMVEGRFSMRERNLSINKQ